MIELVNTRLVDETARERKERGTDWALVRSFLNTAREPMRSRDRAGVFGLNKENLFE